MTNRRRATLGSCKELLFAELRIDCNTDSMGWVVQRVDRFQRCQGWVGFPFAVAVKFLEDQAGKLAALTAYHAFLSIFPLLLVLTTILGFVLGGDPELTKKVMSSALGQFPIIGERSSPRPLTGSPFALVIGLALAMWSGTSVARTMQTAANIVHLVPHIQRPGLLPRVARSIELVGIAGVGLIMTTLLHGLVSVSSHYGVHVGASGTVLVALLAIGVNFLLFSYLFRRVTVRRLRTRDVLPGAALAAVAWSAMQKLGTHLVATKVQGAEGTYGIFAVVIGLLFWCFVLALITMLCMEINVVAAQRLWPRGLGSLSGIADTRADARAYISYIHRGQRAHNITITTHITSAEHTLAPSDMP